MPPLPKNLEVREKHSRNAFVDRYLAVDAESGKKVLLSVPRLDPAEIDPVIRERALQALRRCETLVHPHICAQLGAGVATSGHLWIAHELPEGPAQPATDGAPPRLSLTDAAEALTHVAEGLAYAHAQDIVHGALTPDVILVHGPRTPRLIDFGVGAALYEVGLLAERAHESPFTAPEVLAGGEPTPQADVYALGAIGVHLLLPRDDAAARPTPEELAERAHRITVAGLAGPLGRSLQREPSARFRTAEEMLRQLRTVVAPRAAPSPRRRPASHGRAPARPAEPEFGLGKAIALMAWAGARSALTLLLCLSLIAVATVGGLALAFHQAAPLITVPPLEGRPAAVALALAEQRGLRGVVTREAYDAKVPAGHVTQQSPYAGKTVRAGRALEVVVSLGPPRATVPKLTGHPLEQARTLLSAAGLSLGAVSRRTASARPDLVLEQSPAPGKRIPVNTPVNVTIAVAAKPRRARDRSNEPRAADVRVIVPQGPAVQRVKIEVHYPSGRYTVAYDRVLHPGDVAEVHVTATGEATLHTYIDGEPLPEQPLEPAP